jgi:hypothetical protein
MPKRHVALKEYSIGPFKDRRQLLQMKSRYDAVEQDLAQLAIEAHGGLKRWQRFSSRFLTIDY